MAVAPTSAAEKMEVTVGLLGMFGSIISTQLKQHPLYTFLVTNLMTVLYIKAALDLFLKIDFSEEEEHEDGSRPYFLLHFCFYS